MKRPPVLIVDSTRRAERFQQWLDRCNTVRTASSQAAVRTATDEPVAVTLLRHELPEDVKRDVVAQLATTSPACKLVITSSDESPIVFPDVDADETLHEPITAATLRDTVDTQLRRAVYHDGLRQYYRYSMEYINSRYESNGDDDGTDSRTILQERLDKLTDMLDEMVANLTPADLDAVLASLKQGTTFGTEDDDQTNSAKHRPDKCFTCGLEWGRHYGGSLGEGYSPLGAFTWRCRQCGEVQNVPSPTDRSVARW